MSSFRLFAVVAALLIAGAVATPATAQDKNDKPKDTAASAAGGYKIGVVDIESVIEGYPKKARLMDALQKKVDGNQAEIDKMTDQLKGLQEAYDKGKETFSDADKSAKQGAIRDLITNIKAAREKYQNEIDAEEAKIKREVFGDVVAAIQKVAEAENYHLILNSLNAGSAPAAPVLYASPTIDISQKVKFQLGEGK